VTDRRTVYLALGSNLGKREEYLAGARRAIAALPQTRCIGETPVEETAPLGDSPQDPYLNQMIAIETGLSPHRLLAELHAVEAAAGRIRGAKWAARTLDIDIVMIENEKLSEPHLVVPHPELPNRDFWRRELNQLRGNRE